MCCRLLKSSRLHWASVRRQSLTCSWGEYTSSMETPTVPLKSTRRQSSACVLVCFQRPTPMFSYLEVWWAGTWEYGWVFLKHKTSLSFIIQLKTGSLGHVPCRHSPEDPELLATLGLLHLQVLTCHCRLLSWSHRLQTLVHAKYTNTKTYSVLFSSRLVLFRRLLSTWVVL